MALNLLSLLMSSCLLIFDSLCNSRLEIEPLRLVSSFLNNGVAFNKESTSAENLVDDLSRLRVGELPMFGEGRVLDKVESVNDRLIVDCLGVCRFVVDRLTVGRWGRLTVDRFGFADCFLAAFEDVGGLAFLVCFGLADCLVAVRGRLFGCFLV